MTFLAFPATQSTQDVDLIRQLPLSRAKGNLDAATGSCPQTRWFGLVGGARLMGAKSSQVDNELGGLSTDQGFYLYGQVNTAALERAVRVAQRLTTGEWHLAVHPRCGTNLSVGMLAAGCGYPSALTARVQSSNCWV